MVKLNLLRIQRLRANKYKNSSHYSNLPFIMFGWKISFWSDIVIFTLSCSCPLSVSVQLPSSYRSTKFILLRRFPRGQRSFHFDQEKQDDQQHNHREYASKLVNLKHGCPNEFLPRGRLAETIQSLCCLN